MSKRAASGTAKRLGNTASNSKASNRPIAQLLSAHAIGAGSLGFDGRAGQIDTVSPTTRHRCDVCSELSCSGAKPRRWVPQLVTRFGVIRRV